MKARSTIDVTIYTKFFPLRFKMAGIFENLGNILDILRDWAKDEYKKVLSRH